MRVSLPKLPRFSSRSLVSNNRFKKTVIGRILEKLSPKERLWVALLTTVILVAGTFLTVDAVRNYRAGMKGGVYTEGIVAASLADVEPAVVSLTNDSLLSSDATGALTGQLAESWHVSDDATTIELQLRQGIDRTIVLAAIDPTVQSSPFAGTSVEPFDERGIRIKLKAPFSPFVATLTKHMIPLGPFIVSDRTKEKVVLVARPDYFKGEPQLDSIVLQIFPTTDSLQQALNRNSIDGVAQVTADLVLPKSFTKYELSLPRKTAAFFNMSRDVVKDSAVRQKLVERKSFDQLLTLSVVTTETLATTDAVQTLLNDWAKANVKVVLTVLPASKVQTDIIPLRNYDVLIFGIDLGADPDMYPFWHSSQRTGTGLNLSSFADVNADKLLEQARKTGKDSDRAKLYDQFSQILDTQKPWLVLDQPKLEYAIDKSVAGPLSEAGFYPTDRFKNVSAWYIKR